MDAIVVVAIVAIAGALILSGIGLLAISSVRRRRRKPPPAPQWLSLVEDAVRAGARASAKARELAPVVKDSIQSITSWVESDRPSLRADLAPDGTVTLLFSDIEDSTTLNARLGDERWIAELRTHTKLVRKLVDKHDGHVVKSQGDGFMVAFKEPRRAVGCAVALQRWLTRTPRRREPLRVRVGIHTGTAISEDGDFFGTNVAFAARVAQHARGGEILVSATVRELTDGDGLSFSSGREVELKGIPGVQELFLVDWR